MKGLMFSKFLELLESKFGCELADEPLDHTKLQSAGIYTAVGGYN